MRYKIFAWGFFFTLTACLGAEELPPADTIFYGGDIITINDDSPTVEAIAVIAGKISALGNKSDVMKSKGPHTILIDLHGQTLMPGFINSHTSLLFHGLSLISLDVSPEKYKTHEEIVEAIKRATKKGPVLAFGYDHFLMKNNPELDFTRLDEISLEVPIVVVNKSAQCAYGNHKAFDLVHITDESPNPLMNFFQRDQQGKLTGIAYETPAVGLLISAVTKMTSEDYQALINRTLKVYADWGYTTLTDFGLGLPIPSAVENINALNNISNTPGALARIQGYVFFSLIDTLSTLIRQNNPHFKLVGVSIWADGVLENFTAALKQPYLNQEHSGNVNYSQQQLTDMVLKCREHHFQVAIHACGDRAIDNALTAFEDALRRRPTIDFRHRIENAALIPPVEWRRLSQLKTSCSFAENQIYSLGDRLKNQILGDPRSNWINSAKSANDFGIKFNFYTSSLADQNPLSLIQTAVTRVTEGGKILNFEEKISVDEALKAMTIYPAWQTLREKELGSIEIGKYADFVILSQNPKKVDPLKIKEIKIITTWINGHKRIGQVIK